MEFAKALELLKKGEKMKRPSWSGYWQYDKENDNILMYCKDGGCIEIRQTTDILYTVGNMAADDWEIADVGNSKLLEGIIIKTFTFGEAIRLLKQGERVCRQGWNGKGMWLMLVETPPTEAIHVAGAVYNFLPYIQMKTADNKMVPWLASQTDCLATDWQVAE